jgi:hypothetical protein
VGLPAEAEEPHDKVWGLAEGTRNESLEARRAWPVRLYRLGEEPGEDQSRLNTPEQRLAMMWDLARDAWSLTGRPLPDYPRHETPVSCRPWRLASRDRQ